MTKAYLEKLKAVIEQNLAEEDGIKLGATQSLAIEPKEDGISGDITQAITFDGNGNASFGFSQYCPANISLSAYIDGLDAVYDVVLQSNYSQHEEWHGIKQDQTISLTLKTNMFSKTSVNISIRSSIPNKQASAHLHYSV
jgi:hypothetical protein